MKNLVVRQMVTNTTTRSDGEAGQGKEDTRWMATTTYRTGDDSLLENSPRAVRWKHGLFGAAV